ncbi:MAG: hypothetical protein IOC80_05565 [Rhodobacter sp.]|nr:hypothetical protein [Rhodobacter sp.]MCA3514100.1 hypothetical protein [Rhodobacter sp.]MCA3520159.1 hypothetical protein [Rhodobacter sp.]MCA3522090.1 hypothetical protein [Rhodobacter sp.]MCA3524665.1 hypothetical protein [Rhodobacter sp.]
MKVRTRALFQYPPDITGTQPGATTGFLPPRAPRPGDVMAGLDPDLPLDRNRPPFRGLHARR